MKKFFLSLPLLLIFFLLFAPKASAQLRMTDPSSVASTPNRDFPPAIVEDSLGRIHVFAPSFGNADPSNYENIRLFMSTYNSGTNSFGTPSQVTSLTRITAVAALNDSTGTVNLIIEKTMAPNPGKRDLFWTKNSGSGWSTPLRLTDYADFDTQPTIVETGNGNLGVIFTRWLHYDRNGNLVTGTSDPNYDHTDFDLYQMTYTKNTDTWSVPSAIEATPLVAEAFPTLTKGPSGKLFLAYSSNLEGTWSVMWRAYQSGAWTSPTILESGLNVGYLQQPSIINDMPGKYRLVYASKIICPNELCPTSYSNSTSEIRYRTYDSTTNIWSNPVSLTSRANFYADSPSAIYSSTGEYWLAFRYLNATNWGADTPTANTEIFWMKSLPNTPVGTNVTVDLRAGSSITFDNVTIEGNTTMDTSASNPGDTTGVFKVGDFYYDINTNATYTGGMNVTLRYSDQNMTPEDEAALKVFHWLANSNQWEDATQSVDTVNNIIYARVTSLSWIMIGKYTANLTWLAPITNIKEGETYAFNDGSTLPIKFSLKNINNDSMQDSSVSVKVSGNGGEATFVLGEGTDNIRYDAGSGQYIVNLHTKNYPWIIPGPTYEIKVSNSISDLGTTYFTTLDGGKAQGKNK